MSAPFVLRPGEVEAYHRCRREWDLAARIRQRYVPLVRPRAFDFDKAVRDALAVYYLPAMDDWDRAIVRPIAIQGFQRAMREDRAIQEGARPFDPDEDRAWRAGLDDGTTLLQEYFSWALTVDRFDSLLTDSEFWALVPDPASPDRGLVTPDGRPVHYFGRIDQLIGDLDDEYWVVTHRVVHGAWTEPEELMLDRRTLAAVWAMEYCYPQLRISGTVHNELRHVGMAGPDARAVDAAWPARELDPRDMTMVRRVALRRPPMSPAPQTGNTAAEDAAEADGPSTADRTVVVRQEGDHRFRRTRIRWSRAAIDGARTELALLAGELAAPDLPVYPSPAPEHCGPCAYRAPCLAMNRGEEPGPVLAAGFRQRTEDEFEEERLRWSAVRPRSLRASFGGAARRAR